MAFLDERYFTITFENGDVYDVSSFSDEQIEQVLAAGNVRGWVREVGLTPIIQSSSESSVPNVSVAGPASNAFLQRYYDRFINSQTDQQTLTPQFLLPDDTSYSDDLQEGVFVPETEASKRLSNAETMREAEANAEADSKTRSSDALAEGSGVNTELGDKLGTFLNRAGELAFEAASELNAAKFSDRGEILGEENIERDMRYPLDALEGDLSKIPSVVSFEFFKKDFENLVENNIVNSGNFLPLAVSGVAGIAGAFSVDASEMAQVKFRNQSLIDNNYAYGPLKETQNVYTVTPGQAGVESYEVTPDVFEKYKSNFLSTQGLPGGNANLFVDPVSGDEVVVSQKQVDLDTLSRYKDVRVSRASESTKDRVFMYVPTQLSFSDNISYEDNSQNFLRNTYEAAAGNVTAVAQGIKQGFLSVASDKIGRAVEDRTGINLDLYNGLRGQFGVVSNPKNESMFSGMNRKTFTMNFTFAPTSKREAVMMQNIIQSFRFHSVPQLAPSTLNYLAPHEVEIKFYRTTLLGDDTVKDTFGRDGSSEFKDVTTLENGEEGDSENTITLIENTELPKLGRCFVTAIDTNYSPNPKSAFFVDGTPVQVNMNVSFTQAIMINKQFVMQGF
jgi:hypothetical protein